MFCLAHRDSTIGKTCDHVWKASKAAASCCSKFVEDFADISVLIHAHQVRTNEDKSSPHLREYRRRCSFSHQLASNQRADRHRPVLKKHIILPLRLRYRRIFPVLTRFESVGLPIRESLGSRGPVAL